MVRGCTLNKGSGITLGSETSGGIERVLIEDNAFNGTGVGFRIKSARNRGGFIRDITVQNLHLTDVRFPVPERPVTGLTLDGILIDASEFGKISGVDGLRFKDVQVTAVENTQDRNDSYER
ncbi:glycosyl hydrolase family 28 protein [Enterobacter hormaechei]|nr:glycosyl hydrolase family 28 protein [Enterobacter hormaechei]